jgi:hypothetical protein
MKIIGPSNELGTPRKRTQYLLFVWAPKTTFEPSFADPPKTEPRKQAKKKVWQTKPKKYLG